MKYMKLRNQQGCFCDAETGLVMSGDDVVPYLPPVGRLSRDWLTGGGLLIFEVPDDPDDTSEEDETDPDEPIDGSFADRFYTTEEAQSMNFFTLKKTVAAFGIKADKKDTKETLIKNLMKRQEEIKAQL